VRFPSWTTLKIWTHWSSSIWTRWRKHDSLVWLLKHRVHIRCFFCATLTTGTRSSHFIPVCSYNKGVNQTKPNATLCSLFLCSLGEHYWRQRSCHWHCIFSLWRVLLRCSVSIHFNRNYSLCCF
jgi:hypothetical protein